MANWSNPTATSNYLSFVTEVKDRDVDLALQFDGVSPTNLPTGSIRWNSSINRWQKWSGSAWGELTSTYALTTITATGSVTGTAFIPSASTVPTVGTYLPSANTLGFATASTARGVIDSSGRWLIGSTTNSGGTNSLLQIRPTSGASAAQDAVLINHDNAAGLTVNSYRASTFGIDRAVFNLSGSRGAISAPTLVGTGDYLGVIRFRGYDGSAFTTGAQILGYVDGTPSTNYIPLAFSFLVSPSAGTTTEALRLTSTGNMLLGGSTIATPGFGNTNTGAAYESGKCLFLSRSITATGEGPCLSINSILASGTTRSVTFRRNGATEVGYIETSATSTLYSTSSDYRLKQNVAPLTDGINRLKALKPSRFQFICDSCHTLDGFIAHEVADVVPQAVSGVKDGVDSEGNPIYQGIDQSHLVPLLTAALQEAIARIEALEAQMV